MDKIIISPAKYIQEMVLWIILLHMRRVWEQNH